MEKFFKQSVKEALNFYVYALVDPRDKKIFYVGKGSGDRVFQHAEDSLNDNDESLKFSTIRDIHSANLEVEYYIIRHNLSEHEAYLVESTIIDLLTYEAFNRENILTNVVKGHHQWNEGIKTEEEINILYDCKKIEPIPGDKLLLVSLNKTYKQSKAKGIYRRTDDYESARKYWKLSDAKAHQVQYVLGIYRGIVRIVIKVNTCIKTSIGENGEIYNPPRYIFEGDIQSDSPYLNKDVSDYPFGSGGEKTYIPRDMSYWSSKKEQ